MDDRNREHSIYFEQRSRGKVTGVNDVISFDLNEIILDTDQGILTIQGEDLHVTSLTVNEGEVGIEGTVISMVYMPNAAMKREGGLLRRLFH